MLAAMQALVITRDTSRVQFLMRLGTARCCGSARSKGRQHSIRSFTLKLPYIVQNLPVSPLKLPGLVGAISAYEHVIILQGSSQAGKSGLPYMYRSKRLLVIGLQPSRQTSFVQGLYHRSWTGMAHQPIHEMPLDTVTLSQVLVCLSPDGC